MSTAIDTMIKLMEMLPPPLQDRVLEHLREYIADLQDEARWDAAFEAGQSRLGQLAEQARRQIAEGQAESLDERRL
jgi:uncharacterized protein (DUF3084 family)